MKFIGLIALLFLGPMLLAQGFIDSELRPSLIRVESGAVASADLNGDNVEDILIIGKGEGSSQLIARLYINNGHGVFTEKIDTPFEGLIDGSIDFADVDNDGDQDVFIRGEDIESEAKISLYTNDGQGNFTEVTGLSIDPGEDGEIMVADLDGDDNVDVLISGRISSFSMSTKLYSNNGQGEFNEVIENPFENSSDTYLASSDVDNDGDIDLLMGGSSSLSGRAAKLYLNDGQGFSFTQTTQEIRKGINDGGQAFADVDGDGDDDLLISGSDIGSDPTTTLYFNDGQGIFTEQTGNSFIGLTRTLIAFADIDNDDDQDVMLRGKDGLLVTKIYVNDGLGNFTEFFDSPYEPENFPFIFLDVDNDNDQDLFSLSYSDTFINGSELLLNDGTGNFTEKSVNICDGVYQSSIDFSDIDGDQDLDVLITGSTYSNNSITELLINDGQGNFTRKNNHPFTTEAEDGSVTFEDVDNDNDEDVLITGSKKTVNTYTSPKSELYLNDGQGNFTKVLNTPFVKVSKGSVAFGDLDGDGDSDVLITGLTASNTTTTKLYMNNGSGIFFAKTGLPFIDVMDGSVAFADVDGDNDLDVLITGSIFITNNGSSTKLYLNDGNANFTEDTNNDIVNVTLSSTAFVDVDNDNDLDLFISGVVSLGTSLATKLYLNDGNGNFSEKPDTPFADATKNSFAVADVDSDNDLDIFIMAAWRENTSKLYLNDGIGNFTEVLGTPFEKLTLGASAFADFDNDDDFDLFITGRGDNVNIATKLYLNQLVGSVFAVNGRCYYDINSNQLKDPDEITLPNQIIQINPAPAFSYADENGQFRFYVNDGDHQLAAIPAENWRLTTDSIVDVTLAGQGVSNVNFGFTPTVDISLIQPDISSGPTRCSFDVPFWLNYQNIGTTFENGYVEFTITDDAILQDAQPIPDEIIDNKLIWNFTNLAPFELKNIRLVLKMPDASNLGDTLNFTSTSYVINDNQDVLENTAYTYNPVLNCAYDPNDKAVIPAGIGEDMLTLFDSKFEYKIRFQNTGTDTAFTVRIEDDLDSDLDWKTFRPISASHPYEVNMDLESGKVTFLFNNILLPDSTTNEVLSHGFVKYKISPLTNLSEGTAITNKADIFFDFNEPIITNTTVNRMVSDLSIKVEAGTPTQLVAIPNPFQKSTILKVEFIPGGRGTLNIYDTNGNLFFSEIVLSDTDITFRKEGLASGIYFYEVLDQEGKRVFRGKVIKY